jgi:hypothetical protein
MKQFEELFQPTDTTRIVDVGGYEMNWTLIAAKPNVVLVNLENEEWSKGRIRKRKGDGRNLAFADGSFDLAYSNSVIEHVGGWEDQQAFAREIRRIAPRYYVQTPNKWFFIEPHLMAPFIHLLPMRIARKLVRYFSVWGLVARPTQARIDEFLRSVRLLDAREMRTLFPDAEIVAEKFLGMTKSIIAVRRQRASIGVQRQTGELMKV